MSEAAHDAPPAGGTTTAQPDHEGRSPFQPKDDPQPDDMLTVRVRRIVRDLAESERDRTDAPVDSFGQPRRQVSIDTFAERLMMAGLKLWASKLPDWTDPFAIPEPSAGKS